MKVQAQVESQKPFGGKTMSDDRFRILSLDGGGAKGVYTLGVLREIEALIGCRLCDRFDLIFGTSTGAIIAALLALGRRVEEIQELYDTYVPVVMKRKWRSAKSKALSELAVKVFGDTKFDAMKTNIGIVTTKWDIERPMIFKANPDQAHGRESSFTPGFGCTIGDAVQASCSAYPFFKRKIVTTEKGDVMELMDGGYIANNPTLYAIADAVRAMKVAPERLRVVNVGVGEYPEPKRGPLHGTWWVSWLLSVQLLQKTLELNTQSMDQLRIVLFGDIKTVRISDAFTEPTMATDMFEHNPRKLNLLRQRGVESYAKYEKILKEFLL